MSPLNWGNRPDCPMMHQNPRCVYALISYSSTVTDWLLPCLANCQRFYICYICLSVELLEITAVLFINVAEIETSQNHKHDGAKEMYP